MCSYQPYNGINICKKQNGETLKETTEDDDDTFW